MTFCRKRHHMSEAYPRGGAGGEIRSDREQAAALCVADWLGFAAAPTFAIMALLTSILGGDQSAILCLGAEQMSGPSGMVAMYLLMSAFHLPPWLKLISSRRKWAPARPVVRIRPICSDHSPKSGAATAFDHQHAL